MLRSDTDVVEVLAGQLKIPSLPMWLAVHREIRTNASIRRVFDYLASALPATL
jgi:hypothetical protein